MTTLEECIKMENGEIGFKLYSNVNDYFIKNIDKC